MRWPSFSTVSAAVSRRSVLVAGAICLAIVVAGAAFGPIARARVQREAERRHVDVEVGSVLPGWFAVRLRRVRVRPRGVDGIELRADDVRVGVGLLLSIRSLEIRGGIVSLTGSADDLAERWRAWRSSFAAAAAAPTRKLPVRVEQLALEWRAAPGGALVARADGLDAARDEEGASVGATRIALHDPPFALELGALRARFDPDGRWRGVAADSAGLIWDAPAQTDAPAANGGASDPTPPPLPLAQRRRGAREAAAAIDLAAPLPRMMPDVAALRARIAALARLAAAHVPDGADVAVDGLSFEARDGDDRLAIGPGPLAVRRQGAELAVTFSTKPDASGTPLSVGAQLPLEGGDFVVSLAGGPIALARLGLRDGQAALADVAHATLSGRGRLVVAADAITFDAEIGARGLALRHPKLASDTIRGVDATVLARGALAGDQLRLDDLEASLGALHVAVHGGVEQTADHLAAALAFDAPAASCQALLDSLPTALVPTLRGARMEGTLGARGRLAFDTRKLDDLVLAYDVDDRCAMTEVPEPLAKERFTRPFLHTVYHPDGTLSEEQTGPTTDAWTDIGAISPFMQVAVLTTEDGAFLHHHGFNHAAIRSALIANLKARRFVRGASTITMQLAKNLFLTREKTLSRKLEELILTDYLEQVFTKEEMMELYLNVIEFGPDVYGIAAAADHYFGRKPAELNLAECLFLSSLLPSPVRYHRIFEKGAVPESWMKHIRDLMVIAEKNGKISPEELAQGLSEAIVFHDPALPPPAPRPPVTATHFTGDDDPAADWRELN